MTDWMVPKKSLKQKGNQNWQKLKAKKKKVKKKSCFFFLITDIHYNKCLCEYVY